MNQINKKRRTSILKKRPSTEDDPTEITVSKFPKRAQFSQKKQVKEFTQCEENVTIWGNTYETSVAKSEGSSDGSSTSRKISVDFSHTTINMTTHEAASMNESEKENLMVEKIIPRISDEQRSSLNNLSSASNSGCSIELTTVDMNASERKRVRNYGTDNLNITNMPLDNSYITNKHLNVPGKKPEKVLSPRKMVFYHKNSNLSVIIKDKVLLSPSEMDDNVSVSIEDDEKEENFKSTKTLRKTIAKPVDMNISVEHKTSQEKKIDAKNERKQPTAFKQASIPKITTSIFKSPALEKPQSVSTIVPTIFKVPELPKTFNFQPQCYDSPPIKPAALENQKEEIDELFEMMVSDTPSKNLCCLGKTHTPVRSAQKVLFSASRPMSLRKSTDIFKEIGLIDDDEDEKPKTVRRTIFHDDSMKLEVNHKDDNRKTIFDKIKMDETLEANNKAQSDGDLDISVKPEVKTNSVPSKDEIFTDKMEETCTEKRNDKSAVQKSFFELDDDDASCSVARNIQLMKLKPVDFDFVEKSLKRSTLSNNDTCNATNFIMELTNIDDTGGSLETTAEIQRKAAKLLKNPHATLGSSSTINSPFPEDISDTMYKEPSKIHKSLNLGPDTTFENLQKSSTSYKNRMTTFDENKMEISGIEPTIEDPNEFPMLRKSHLEMSHKNVSRIKEDLGNQSGKNRTTTYNVDQMDISRMNSPVNPEHTNTASLKLQKSYEIHVSPKEMAKLKEKSYTVPTNIEEPKKRVTTYNVDNMDLSSSELTATGRQPEVLRDSVIKSVKSTSKIQIYTDESITIEEETRNKRVTTFNNNDLNVSIAATDKKRATSYHLNDMDVSRGEENRPMENLYSPCQEDITDFVPRDVRLHKSLMMEATKLNFNPTNETLKTIDNQATKNRATTYNIDQMDVTNVETMSHEPVKKSYNSRATTYNADQMDVTNVETMSHVPAHKSYNSRATTYNIDQMDVTNVGTMSYQPAKKSYNSRVTTYNSDQMDVSRAEPTSHIMKDMTETNANIPKIKSDVIHDSRSFKSRATTYNMDQMDMTIVGETTQHPKNLDHSITSNLRISAPYQIHVSPKELAIINRSLQKSTEEPKKRVTTYKSNDMDVTGCEDADLQAQKTRESIVHNTKSQIQIYNDENMSMELKDDLTENKHATVTNNKNRTTTYNPNDMNVTVAATDKKRATNFNMDISGIEATDEFLKQFVVKNPVNEVKSVNNNADMTLENTVSTKNRATTYNVNQMEISRAEASFNMPEHSNTATLRVQRQYEVHVSPREIAKAKREVPKSRVTTYNVGKMDISGTESKNQAENSNLPPKIQINNDDIDQNMSMEVRESPLHKKRATTYMRNNMDVSGVIAENKRKTSYLVNNMDVSGSCGSSGFIEQSPTVETEVESNDRRKTFTVMKRESLKWHNITDTDLLNMIDDESNPCVQDISGSIPVSNEASNMSRYDEAIEDFMNLTVKASPLNQSVPFEVKMRQRRESKIPSPVPDYNNMFDNLVENLKQQDRPKPRLEIDEYLEKLKIEPIKIPRYPQNQEGYLLNKIKELRQKHNDKAEERRRLKKEIEATHFPQIPSEKFLIKNYIECMETEMLKEIELRRPVIAPVFPETIDFEKLLNNKFRTDENLSKYWNLDTLFWYKGRFKLTHKNMSMFTLNFICQQYLTEADESTIPIIFKDVMLYLDPDFRKPWSTTMKNGLSRREFHRAIHGVDNFTSICSSSNQLFTFVDYYQANVVKANETVNNFFNIVNKYKAVFKVHPVYKYDMIRKRCFLSDDTVDIEISVDSYLDDISIRNLSIEGNEYTYSLEPHTNLGEMKGLMLVELVLFDTEKFLQINTRRVLIEEDL
ncbi:uncharacterized protein [Chironomus tepperi]|uniref:uncharacterized protein n=1 Tax=Chironomus tepperi TaxID=113505 RepID=UPI00391EF2D8